MLEEKALKKIREGKYSSQWKNMTKTPVGGKITCGGIWGSEEGQSD